MRAEGKPRTDLSLSPLPPSCPLPFAAAATKQTGLCAPFLRWDERSPKSAATDADEEYGLQEKEEDRDRESSSSKGEIGGAEVQGALISLVRYVSAWVPAPEIIDVTLEMAGNSKLRLGNLL